MAIGNATRKKNSGMLRYTFGNQAIENARSAQRASIVGQASPTILTCLGVDTGVNVDSDDQVFGEFPGTVAHPGATGTLFNGTAAAIGDFVQTCPIVIDPTTGAFVEPTKGRFPAYIPARAANGDGHLSGATKVYAWFQASDIDLGLSTAPGDAPAIVVQTEVKTGRLVRGGIEDTDGPLYICTIRVAIKNLGLNTSAAAGTLFVELQHSEHDIMGALVQDLDMAVVAA
jgi:hypothetical protein